MFFRFFHFRRLLAVTIAGSVLLTGVSLAAGLSVSAAKEDGSYIKWVDFSVPYALLENALNADISSFGEEVHFNFVELLCIMAAKYGGNFKQYKKKDLDAVMQGLRDGKSAQELSCNGKLFAYYIEAYGSILKEYVGPYTVEEPDPSDSSKTILVQKYGLKVFSPIAQGFYYNHYDDFGVSRSYGYNRKHLGNDLVGLIGAPVIAVEGGVVEAAGWNQYGGWRIGIRSFDGRRYYYYAHLRKNHPFAAGIQVGKTVSAGDVIGYLGRTGYSSNENTNNINTPHLHFGIQLIFDQSQKDGVNQIWIDVYNIVRLLESHRSAVVRDIKTNEYTSKYKITSGW